MQSERDSFDSPEKVGWLMAALFRLYLSYSSGSFRFGWLQKTVDLKVRCRDTTSDKAVFPISSDLLKAIHKCERVTAPEKSRGLPSDWGFSGFMKTAAHQVLDEVPFTQSEEFHGPLFRWLGVGIMINSYPAIKGVQIFIITTGAA
ncbi:hypothetical protein CPC735_010270 [Coccidioides posadasii C735 delta SOWgp]|uniref:Uncharacterized protein n=1 Tax=Coccidioides posadasii (strain C735) TaxID=222929 RepID=C5P879_COCP7|nr:hypothetical protein CPC735_010270 [Coccidioides posadasii C735 delta SOWgp]EER26850.1 hypothetical protein CPC735_010270 [Coccidioides posadasii C735 delta SOWgp]|eukprot:XP_003068995.1 hypothetical protein CPC735_010270 [Coccidioides posadasii C735 delta SOWgp]